jgi:hypothetical protein
MKHINFAVMSIDQLVDRFAEIGIAQYDALLYDQLSKFKKLYWQMDSVDKELRSRGRQARLALLPLYQHPNIQVRLKAAVHTLGVAPDAARNILRIIKESGWLPQAGDAGMLLRSLDRGEYKPD